MNEEGTIPFCCDYLKNYAKEQLYLLLFYKIKKKNRTLDRKRQELNRRKRLLMKLLKEKRRTKALESNSLRSFPKRRHKKIPVVFFLNKKFPFQIFLLVSQAWAQESVLYSGRWFWRKWPKRPQASLSGKNFHMFIYVRLLLFFWSLRF